VSISSDACGQSADPSVISAAETDDFDDAPVAEVAPVKAAIKTKAAPAAKVDKVEKQVEEPVAAQTPVKVQEKIGSFPFSCLSENQQWR
jgi:hypothetical protein